MGELHPLRRLFVSRLAALVASTQELPPEQIDREVEALTRLDSLARIAESRVQPAPFRLTWQVAVAIAVILVCLLALVLRPRTEVDLELTTGAVSFTSVDEAVLNSPLQFSSLSVQSSDGKPLSITLPPVAQFLANPERSVTAFTVAGTDAAWRGEMQPLLLKRGTRVTVQRRGDLLRLDVEPARARCDPSASFSVSLGGTARIDGLASDSVAVAIGDHKSLLVKAGCRGVRLELVASTAEADTFRPTLAVAAPAFVEPEHDVIDQRMRTRPVSSVVAGTVTNLTTGAQPYVVRPREWLRLESFEGQLRTIAPHDKGLALVLHGSTRDLLAGARNEPRNLAPSWLEVIAAIKPLWLFYSAAGALIGALLGIQQWLEKHGRSS